MKQIALLFLFLGFVMPCLSQNLPPVAVNDTITASPGDTVYVNVLKNDYDPEGDSI